MTSENPTVVFDVGNVLLRWDPRNLYRKLFDDETRMEWFLSTICTGEWNLEQDRGRDWDEAVALLVKDYPDHEAPIRAFHERWHETVSGVIEDNVALLDRLRQAGVPTYCITNFSGPKFIEARERFPVPRKLRWRHRVRRRAAPEAGCRDLLSAAQSVWPRCARLRLHRRLEGQCGSARAVGMHAIQYAEPMDLATELRRYGILP